MDFRWDHRRALSQAVKNKNRIPRLEPFTPIADTEFVDQTYYNPDQALNQIKSMSQGAAKKMANFAGPQGLASNIQSTQRFDAVANILSNYEDKNVAAANRENMTNTNISNIASERLKNAITSHHDKMTTLNQEYTNARINADNNIMENEIAMWNERKNRLNLEATIGEQFATDPNTGLHEFVQSKDFSPSQAPTKTMADQYNDLRSQMPGAKPEEVMALMKMMNSGKYTYDNNATSRG